MDSKLNVGDAIVIGSNGIATVVAAPKRVWRKVRPANVAPVAWLERTTDRGSEAGAVLSFRSVL